MFNIFKKKNSSIKFGKSELTFFKGLFSLLPEKYNYLNSQVNPEFLFEFKENILGYKNSYTNIVNASLEPQYKNRLLPGFFILNGISVLDEKRKSRIELEIYVIEGMFLGFKIDTLDFENLSLTSLDLTNLDEKHFNNEDKIQLEKIINNKATEYTDKIDFDNTFKIVIGKENFYVIKNVGDGNYLAVNNKKEIFELIHDPFRINKIFNSLEEYIKSL